MYTVVKKEHLSENVFLLEVEAPLIARNRKAGHFVIVKIGEKGERIPLTLVDSDTSKGTITLIAQKVGVSSAKLSKLEKGDFITDVAGPLGNATHTDYVGTVLCAGGGVGIAPLLPIARAFKKSGNRVLSVIAGRNKDLVILEKEMRECSDELIVMTDDGTLGRQGLVTHGMDEFLAREKVNLSVVIGPAVMMKFASAQTLKYNVPTLASLNTIMVDGTGMCGACRVTVDGKTRFVCIDGPEFDAHKVNFDEMLQRLGGYREQEMAAYNEYQAVRS
jgi:ferredoxin/flavodoxin---NADP+ reductase